MNIYYLFINSIIIFYILRTKYMLKKILPTDIFSFEDKSKQKCIQPWVQQSRKQLKNEEDSEKQKNSQTKLLSNPKKGQNIQKKGQTSNISSQYHTVKDFKDKQSKQLNENVKIKRNQKNPDLIDDDLNDFHELLQFQALNISQILPLKLMQKQVLENSNSKRENQKLSQPNENYKNFQKNKKEKPEFLKLIKQINRQQKQEERNRLFQNLNQNQVKSLILGSYIDKLLSDPSLKFLKQMPQKFPGSNRIPKEQKSFLLMLLQEVVQQVELDASRFTPKGYKFKVEGNVKETIEFSKKIQTHFTFAKINLIYKLTQAYKNMDYIHAEAKKILFRNLIKITKQHQEYKQKLKIKFQKTERKIKNEPSSKQSDTPQKNMYTRSWAAQSQDYQFFELKGQMKKKNSSHSEEYKEDLKSLHGRLGKFCQEEDVKSIGLSQNNCVFGYRSDFEYPTLDTKQKQTSINMQKNFKRIYQNECGLWKQAVKQKSKQKQKQRLTNEKNNKFGQISRSLQKWKQRQRQNVRNNCEVKDRHSERKQQYTQTQDRKILKISKQTQFKFQPASFNTIKQIVNVLYTETPRGQNPIPDEDKKSYSYLSDNLESNQEEKGLAIQFQSPDSFSISLSAESKVNKQGDYSISLRGQKSREQNSRRQNSIMNSTGQLDKETSQSWKQRKFDNNEEREKEIEYDDDSDSNSDDSQGSSDQQETFNEQNIQLFDLNKIIDAKIKSKDVTKNCILEKQEQESYYQEWNSESSSHGQMTSIRNQPILGQTGITNPETIIKNKNECLYPHQNQVHGNQVLKKDMKQQQQKQIGKSQTKVTKNIPPLPSSNSNPASNLQPYRKLSLFLKGRLLPEVCQQFQLYFTTYFNSKPAFHVQKRRKLLDFVFEVCQQIQKTRKSAGVGGVLGNDKNAKLGIELCKLLNEQKVKYLKDISLKYYKDYFPVEQKREIFSDVKQIISLFRLHK